MAANAPQPSPPPDLPQDTEAQYWHYLGQARAVFTAKMQDYGAAWRVLRPTSLTDQLFIKAKRIRTLEEKPSRVGEPIPPELLALINYCIMGLILLKETLPAEQLDPAATLHPDVEAQLAAYDAQAQHVFETLQAKNHDYGEAWRSMRATSFTDLILMKLLRIKQIEDRQGRTEVSEGIDAGYTDILNYAVFYLIQMQA